MRASKLLVVLTVASAACGGGGDGGTNPPPPPAVNSVSLSSTNANLRISESQTITATPKDASGNSLTGRTVAWSLNPATGVASMVTNGASVTVTGTAVGTAQLTATVEQKTATAQIVVTNQPFPSTADVTVSNNSFTPDVVNIAAGGTVTWSWAQGAVTHNVTFGSGPATIATIGDRNTGGDSRTFNVAGTYNYSCTRHSGMNGTVIVH